MSIIDTLKNISGGQETETEKELREFTNQRQYEREVFNSALRNWLLKSGLGPIMMEQMEEFAHQAGLDGWPEQFEMYDRDFTPRNPQHKEILDHIHDRVDEVTKEGDDDV